MATLFIHIGMMKTGTTSLQSFFVMNRNNLEKIGIVYPEFIQEKNHINKNINGFWLIANDKEVQRERFQKINSILKEGKSVLLSCENLWKRAQDEKFWRFVRRNVIPEADIKMIAYIRRQDDFVYSRWAQLVGAQNSNYDNSVSFSEFLNDYEKWVMVDYAAYFDAVEPEIGIENMLIRIYERSRFAENSLYFDFLHLLTGDPAMTESIRWEYPEKEKNPSLKGSVLEAKRLLNAVPEFSSAPEFGGFPYMYHAQKQLQEEGMLREAQIFSKEDRLDFLQQFEESNARVARKYFGREDGVLFTDTPQEDGRKEAGYTIEDLSFVYGLMIKELMLERNQLRDENSALNTELKKARQKIRRLKGHTDPDSKKMKHRIKNRLG